MPQALTAFETQLETMGFAKRDLGVAMAIAFVSNYETATNQTVPDNASVIAAKSVAAAIAQHWGANYRKLEPAAQEKIYESLLISSSLLSAFAQQFEQAGKTQEAAGMRQAAGELFRKLIGVAPAQVKIAADGRITGLAADASAPAKQNETAPAPANTTAPANTPPATSPSARPAQEARGGRGGNNLQSRKIVLTAADATTNNRSGKNNNGNNSDEALPAAKLNGAQVFVKYRISYATSIQTNFDHLLLFPDGTAFDGIPSKPLPSFDVATLKAALEPDETGQWKIEGDTLVLSFPKSKSEPRRMLKRHPKGWYAGDGAAGDSAYDIYYPVVAPTRQTMLGAWENSNLNSVGMMGGGAPMVTVGSNGSFYFNSDGTYSNERKSFASSTTANMGDAFRGDLSVGIYHDDKTRAAGRWRLDDVLLTTEKDGRRSIQLAFVLPHWGQGKGINENPDLMITGDWWRRPEDK